MHETLGAKGCCPSFPLLRIVLALSSALSLALSLALAVILPAPASAQSPGLIAPDFSKSFSPSAVGPGSVSVLTFDIGNLAGAPVDEIAFVDNLPAGLVIATPASAITDCGGGVFLDAPDGGSTITLSDGQLAPGASCFVSVNVVSTSMPTSGSPITHMNVSSMLSSTFGTAGPATADLTVTAGLPGFTKSFSPATVAPNQVSTLTLTIDNTANPSGAATLRVTDNLPTGMVIASPSRASTDCGNALLPPTLTAVSGSSTISLFANGLLPNFPAIEAGESCTIVVDVLAEGPGRYINVANNLEVSAVGVGLATAALEVQLDSLAKAFIDDPVPPGGTTTLEFTITNFDRNFSATDLAFTDTLGFVLKGLVATDLPKSDICGEGSLLSGTSLVSFTGGALPPMGSCTFSVTVAVPLGTPSGEYLNTTSALTGTLDGSPFTGNTASDILQVVPAPILTKEFLDDPVSPGDPVMLEFTLTNTSATDSATDITFEDVFDTVIRTASVTPPAECCGPGSSCIFTPYFNPSPPCNPCDGIPARLTVTGANLEPAGMAGESCTFSMTLDVEVTAESGIYPNTTTDVTATVAAETVIGKGASDDLVIVAAPTLSKSFDPAVAAPGETVSLEFTLELSPNSPAEATDITFTDDLNAALAGLAAVLPSSPDPPCGAGSTLVGTMSNTFLTLEGGSLQPGTSCTFSVDVVVPMDAASGVATNTTSGVDALVDGQAVTAAPASAMLNISDVRFTKEFLGDPVIAGESVTLRFTIENLDPVNPVGSLFFTDALANILPGTPDVTAILPEDSNSCNGTVSGSPTSLVYSGGSVTAGGTCTIDFTVVVPAGVADGTYLNTTSNLSTDAGIFDPATDSLVIDSTRLQLTKSFTDDPVAPGDPVTLEFVLTNLDASRAASGIAFVDNLGATLSGLVFDSILFDDCSGTVTGEGTTMVDVSDISLPAAASCTLRLALDVPGGAAAGSYPNTTTGMTGTIDGHAVVGTAATDTLDVFQLLDFSKSFDGPTVGGGTAILTFTITNPGAGTVSNLAFNDDLNAALSGLVAVGMMPEAPCGESSSITGTSLLLFANGELGPMETCTFDIEVMAPLGAAAGLYLNTTGELFQFGLVVATPATANLEIEPPPTFHKVFDPDVTGVGVPTTLIFTIDNADSVLEATALDFTDNLPAGLVVATPANASTTCTGGTLSAVPGSGVVSYTGGAVAAGASCTVQADVVTDSTGFFDNTSGALTSSSGNSGTAHDTLAVDPAPDFHKSFSPNRIAIDGVSTLTFTIDNTFATVAATGLAFTDVLPTEVVIADPADGVNGCTGGTVTAVAGTGTITYTGGSVAAGATCTIQVDVTSSIVGMHTNLTGDLTSSLGNSGTARATLTVNPPPGFSKSFAPNPNIIGGVVTLTFVIDNASSTASATDLDFTDVLPAGLLVADPANVTNGCSGGTVTAVAGTDTISWTGGTVSSGSVCTLSVDVTATASGDLLNTTGDLTSSLGNSGTAEASLRINPPPGFAKAFQPSSILVGDVSTLVFSINNSSSTVVATDLDFTDTLPADVLIADPANATTDCDGGILTAEPETDAIAYTGGSVSEMASCTVSVDVTSSVLGMHLNTSGELSSSLGTSDPAEATLTVEDLEPPVVTVVTAGGVALEDCATIRNPISSIAVVIEDDRTPILGADSTAAYLLVGAGADGDFATSSCAGGVSGDDVNIPISGAVVSGEDPLIANVSLTLSVGEDGLAAGLYRFFVCDTITDTAGNALDGNADGTPGPDFQVGQFRADPSNLFVNGNFDDCPVTLDPWVSTATPPSTVQAGVVGTDDFEGSPLSSSVRLAQSDFPASLVSQCVAVQGNAPYDFEHRQRYQPLTGGLGILVKTCEFFDAADCGGAMIDEVSVAALLENEGGGWRFSETLVQAPADALSARCSFEAGPLGSDPFFDLYLDGLFLGSGDLFRIFEDGFESGNTSAWSTSSP